MGRYKIADLIKITALLQLQLERTCNGVAKEVARLCYMLKLKKKTETESSTASLF